MKPRTHSRHCGISKHWLLDFRNGAARAMIAKLAAKGYKSYVAAGAAARDGRWRVRIGPFDTREAADRQAAVIKNEQQLPTWVLSEEG